MSHDWAKSVENRNRRQLVLQKTSKWLLLGALGLIVLAFQILASEFFTMFNMMAVMRSACIIGFMAISNVFILNTGGLNFAQGAQVTLTGAIIGKLMMLWPDNMYWAAALISIIVGVAISGIVSIFVVGLGVPPFIATLALQTILMGVCRYLTDNTVMFSNKWGPNFIVLGQGMLFGVIPYPVIIFAVFAIFAHLFLERMRIGRYIYAVGLSATTCKQVGINVKKTKYIAYLMSGFFISLAGVVYVSYVNSVNLTAGTTLFSLATCTVMLSATFYKPGKYNIPGVTVAAFMMYLIQNGVITAGGSFFVRDFIQGVLLVISILIIALVRKEGLPSVNFGS